MYSVECAGEFVGAGGILMKIGGLRPIINGLWSLCVHSVEVVSTQTEDRISDPN